MHVILDAFRFCLSATNNATRRNMRGALISGVCIAEYPRADGGVSGKNERAGGTSQGDSHATGELTLISYPTYYFCNATSSVIYTRPRALPFEASETLGCKVFTPRSLIRDLVVLVVKDLAR